MGLFTPFNNFSNIYTRDFLTLKTVSGTTAITDASQTESTPFTLLTITAVLDHINDCDIWLDLAKATTGFAAVETSITAQFACARAIDGTNYRREAYAEAALSGTLAALRAAKLIVGRIPAGQSVRIMAVFSADITADINIPYQLVYRGLSAPTVA